MNANATQATFQATDHGGRRQKLDTSFPTANAAVQLLEALGIVAELTGQKKNRVYSYQPYIELLMR